MQSCSSALCVLILLITTVTAVSGDVSIEVKVKLNDSATLPCYHKCSGLVRWSQKSSGVVAQCDQTSCLSVKDGFVMFHDLYLKGNNSLIIPVADLSKSGEYTCQCDLWGTSNVLLYVERSYIHSVEANPHESVTLFCYENCSGLATWIRNYNYKDIVAKCDQTSCQSMKAGHQMICDQYLKGNLSLVITNVDFSMRGLYTCQCDGTDHRDVELIITALNSTVQIKPGESLVLDLETPDPVEVLYDGTGADNSSSGQICKVDGRSLQCSHDYKQRVAVVFELKGMKLSDSGVYTIWDARTKKVLYEYTVIIQDDPNAHGEQKIVLSVLELTGIVMGTVISTLIFIIVMYVLVVVICRMRSSPCGGACEMRTIRRTGEDNQDTEEQNILPPDQQ